ncbi:MAG: ATP-dependent DNA helicase RecQ [Candidatus Accumulibacter appositus]|uniref:ATP-dependent DNA helicase RecQ n=1 Tax=Candidatus Accumulibacter appositus TaxID=1454003 RepID=A0A011Q111_9PROT|nr:HRDC domain-containing protein [Accumulibacter sp.]EXI82855.1 MAG: ATP-dependent DNA helicase RecQ [Candidatus Accumulibacter appositus]HRF05106.1 HRDC domain-containing protein [Accumulibacter sp.]
MSYRFFAIPACNPGAAEAELNQLLAASRVLSVERQLVAAGEASFWAICVSLAPGPGPLPDALKADQGSARRIDYREVLNDADFAVFVQLRALRKSIAESEAVAQYAVFTNEQLANMVRGRVRTLEALGAIDGVGPARLERYAERFLAVLQQALAPA